MTVKYQLLLHADDSVLHALGTVLAGIEAALSSKLESVKDWLTNNKLYHDLGKTQSIVFGTKRKLRKCSTLSTVCNKNVIESKSTVTYLGITLDQFLSDRYHF